MHNLAGADPGYRCTIFPQPKSNQIKKWRLRRRKCAKHNNGV